MIHTYVHTLRLKSLWPLASVWCKTAQNTDNVGGAGADPQTLKMVSFFLISVEIRIPIYSYFQKMELREELSNKNFLFLLRTIKVEFLI